MTPSRSAATEPRTATRHSRSTQNRSKLLPSRRLAWLASSMPSDAAKMPTAGGLPSRSRTTVLLTVNEPLVLSSHATPVALTPSIPATRATPSGVNPPMPYWRSRGWISTAVARRNENRSEIWPCALVVRPRTATSVAMPRTVPATVSATRRGREPTARTISPSQLRQPSRETGRSGAGGFARPGSPPGASAGGLTGSAPGR